MTGRKVLNGDETSKFIVFVCVLPWIDHKHKIYPKTLFSDYIKSKIVFADLQMASIDRLSESDCSRKMKKVRSVHEATIDGHISIVVSSETNYRVGERH